MSISKLSDLADPEITPRLVFKIGSALLFGRGGVADREWLAGLVWEIADARERGQQVIVVCSGAVALGAAKLGFEKGGRGSLADAQASAAVGQIELAGLWSQLLGAHGITAAQILLTLDDLEGRRRYLNVSATLGRLLKAGAVPVVNENDSVATDGIRFGDNDRLAARVAQAGKADAIVLFSDVDGLYDRNPAEEGAQLLRVVEGVTEAEHAMASGSSGSGMGSGGMTTKLRAVEIAERAGISLTIVNGTHRRPFGKAIDSDTGTLFLPKRRDTGRKAWLGGRMRMKGHLVVDTGCAKALTSGSSLLASGITAVEGEFTRGDPVGIKDQDGRALAKGLAEYDSFEILRIMGTRSEDQAMLLGYSPRSAVVHRDQLVLL
ncbi:glutamate 5-kinase [Altererythrobacter atlanticus]|uniref:Glutamate 5-kinase n=1 Tax=Croceibacterium atlanticum TaxID=1267766 RepID=A0A0F7KT24_9SPHN|nr:glutamate 5-kinase [Croceibacterium atlanticum]AKH42372.1 Glutamate 5-kinase [Croceibacterium atlanticum]MBB5731149.1 glutamate 5-kinase [Croceibacterium atlanticum]